MTFLWPGLPQLWVDGTWSGLALAVGFGILVDVWLLTTLVWVELVERSWVPVGWIGLGLVWLSSACFSMWLRRSEPAEVARQSAEDLFRAALAEYLKGNWFEAEKILVSLLAEHPRDVEARLMLATLLRHTRRYREANDELSRLELIEASRTWTVEIASERQRLRSLEEGFAEFLGKPAADEASAEPSTLAA